ncbi:MAG: xylulokinase [Tepidisphaera sp.]
MLLGIDVGTSSVKAVLLDPSGRVLAVGSAPVPLLTPAPGWTEQDPEAWWQATIHAVKQAISIAHASPSDIRAVGLSGQMHGSVFLDAPSVLSGGRSPGAIRPALLWNDQRTADELEGIEATAGGRASLVKAVGNAALTGFQLPKLLWLRRHEPQHFAKTAAVLLPKDYIRFRMSGELITDTGDASGTLVLDVEHRRWRTDLIAKLGLNPSLFPRIVESASPAGTISEFGAEALGLRKGTLIVGGSGDNQCGAVGAGIVEPGRALAILGTSGVVYAHTDRFSPDLPAGRTHAMCSAAGANAWCVTGVMLSAAGSLQWASDKLFPGVPMETLLAEAWATPAGAEGLVFAPYLQGERCPHPDPNARGAFVGLSLRHGRGHMVRSIIEGVSFAMTEILTLVRSLGVDVRSLRVGGGGAKSPQWRQLLADLASVPVEVPTTEEGGAYGAALLAGVGAGVWPTVADACHACIQTTDRAEPRPLDPALAASQAAFSHLYPRLLASRHA